MSFFEARGISIRFGGLVALNDVSFEVKQGKVFTIIGPNGAGKTTIFNCINRYYDLDEGEFLFKGNNITRVNPHIVAELGISRTFQNTELFRNFTVMDNLLLGRHRHRRTNLLKEALFTQSVRKQEIENREKAEEIIDFLNLKPYRDRMVAGLPYGIQKIVELGRALAMEPELLLLDEPSSGMNTEETEDMAFWISDIKEQLGITIIIVEHDMKLVKELSDRVLALNFGMPITQGNLEDVLSHPEVIKAYLGEKDAFSPA
jgi:branched-chain amino acid transport system ATP-binding protein